jgi:membrane protein implicated in regulation of membrane protease activity
LDASDWLWVWVGTAIAFAVFELVTPVLFFAISFAVGAAIAAVASLVDVGVGVQWGVFVLGTAGSLAVLVPIGRRIAVAEGDDEPEGASRWVGRVAIVLEEIPAGTHATGLVRLERARWRAETVDDHAVPAGTEVEVLSVRGTRLVVAPVHAPRLESGAP